jgi:YbbR domain-containing protein
MLPILRNIAKNLPTLLLTFALSIAVWVSAVTHENPNEERLYPRSVSVEVVGKEPNLVIVSNIPSTVSVTLVAPATVWDQLLREQSPVRAVIDLSNLGPGEHQVPVQIQVSVSPVRVVSFTPSSVDLTLDTVVSSLFPVQIVLRGEPAIGYQAGTPQISETSVSVSGPSSLVDQVQEVRAILDITGASENIDRSLNLEAVDINGDAVQNVTITPSVVEVTLDIKQLGGYRNVVVKVVTSGQVSSGYRVTNISVFPPAVTVFSNDPNLVEQLPGYVETETLDLTGLKDDLDVFLSLNLPPGVTLVGDQTVEVQVGIAAIEGSITLENMKVNIAGLSEGLTAEVSPATVDVILSGPLPVLDTLRSTDINIVINLEGVGVGVYQRIPQVQINAQDVRVQSILPASLEVKVSGATTPTAAISGGAGQISTATPNVTPTP